MTRVKQWPSKLVDKIVFKIVSAVWTFIRRRRGHALLRVDSLRTAIVRWRKDYFINRRRNLRTWNQITRVREEISAVIENNLGGL